ncbi:MAG TPA: GNAT family N-acetyltransferase [Pirellulales bacterium]|nr:GNAT family N-acetyltransferase [Pirellulales bacterium]
MQFAPDSKPQVSFYLTADWAEPPGGVIPLPSAEDIVFERPHAGLLLSCLPDRRQFQIWLKWRDWSDEGRGFIPYEFFDLRVIECWVIYGRPMDLRIFREKRIDSHHARWFAEDPDGHRLYGFDVRSPTSPERYAWAFVVERDGGLEVEELYVRPEHRRSGHGRWLAERVAQLAREKKMSLRLWVNFADCKEENEENYPAIVAVARRLGVRFQRCPVRWAAYFATNDQPGEEFPIAPALIPMRPRLPRKEFLAMIATLGIGTGEPVAVATSDVAPIVTSARGANEIVIGSEDWGRLTERRAELIDKKYREGLSTEELAEYEQLQAQSREVIARRFPISDDLANQLAAAKKRLGLQEGSAEE